MGNRDYYVGAIKGFIYKRIPHAQIVDISHAIRPFNIVEAAFCVSNVIDDFPERTIHVLAVNSDPKIDINNPSKYDEWPLVMTYRGQYFVGIDNGIFSLIVKDISSAEFFRMTEAMISPGLHRFPAKNLLTKIACQIAEGQDLNLIGEKIESCKIVSDLTPVTEPNLIRGHVLHIDGYGNLITNITEALFNKIGSNEPFVIYFRSKSYFIDKIHSTYNEVPHGERVAIFNSNGLLEIAVNMGVHKNGGGANTLFGLKERDIVRIEFTPPGSKESIDSLF